MQTFLPYPDFAKSAKALDRQRLGKQRIETIQILKALLNLSGGWANHPATLMWKGHEYLLAEYGIAICDEWISRGYKDTCRSQLIEIQGTCTVSDQKPWWLGNAEIHRSWQSLLLRKNPEYYSPLFPDVGDDVPFEFPPQVPPAQDAKTVS